MECEFQGLEVMASSLKTMVSPVLFPHPYRSANNCLTFLAWGCCVNQRRTDCEHTHPLTIIDTQTLPCEILNWLL